jgi:hypothetical protein
VEARDEDLMLSVCSDLEDVVAEIGENIGGDLDP